ncbi:MAG TPA: GNAT family N-acetyltransferase, partial [Oligoflexus sp.]|uniref:GNAT family N-acetyltransferase n=1 Tax=Oligoflexus sp. TaxID=1971216 RepID=UPI002D351F6E
LQQCEPEGNRVARFPAREREPFMRHWRSSVLGNARNLALTIVADGEVAGNIGSWDQDGFRLISYWLGVAFWGRGVATAALTEFLAHHERTRPLHAYVAARNLGSCRVLEKCAFHPLGSPTAGEDGELELLMNLELLPAAGDHYRVD